MTDHRCKTCKHWERGKDPPFEGFLSIDHLGWCNCMKFRYDGKTAGDCLLYWDSERINAWFCTGEDFGCIHWKGGA